MAAIPEDIIETILAAESFRKLFIMENFREINWEEIRKTRNELALLCHPDKNGANGAQAFQKVNSLFKKISEAKKNYDSFIQLVGTNDKIKLYVDEYETLFVYIEDENTRNELQRRFPTLSVKAITDSHDKTKITCVYLSDLALFIKKYNHEQLTYASSFKASLENGVPDELEKLLEGDAPYLNNAIASFNTKTGKTVSLFLIEKFSYEKAIPMISKTLSKTRSFYQIQNELEFLNGLNLQNYPQLKAVITNKTQESNAAKQNEAEKEEKKQRELLQKIADGLNKQGLISWLLTTRQKERRPEFSIHQGTPSYIAISFPVDGSNAHIEGIQGVFKEELGITLEPYFFGPYKDQVSLRIMNVIDILPSKLSRDMTKKYKKLMTDGKACADAADVLNKLNLFRRLFSARLFEKNPDCFKFTVSNAIMGIEVRVPIRVRTFARHLCGVFDSVGFKQADIDHTNEYARVTIPLDPCLSKFLRDTESVTNKLLRDMSRKPSRKPSYNAATPERTSVPQGDEKHRIAISESFNQLNLFKGIVPEEILRKNPNHFRFQVGGNGAADVEIFIPSEWFLLSEALALALAVERYIDRSQDPIHIKFFIDNTSLPKTRENLKQNFSKSLRLKFSDSLCRLLNRVNLFENILEGNIEFKPVELNDKANFDNAIAIRVSLPKNQKIIQCFTQAVKDSLNPGFFTTNVNGSNGNVIIDIGYKYFLGFYDKLNKSQSHFPVTLKERMESLHSNPMSGSSSSQLLPRARAQTENNGNGESSSSKRSIPSNLPSNRGFFNPSNRTASGMPVPGTPMNGSASRGNPACGSAHRG